VSIEQLERRVKDLEECLALLKGALEKRKVEPVSKKRWRAQKGGIYWSMNGRGVRLSDFESGSTWDDHRYAIGSYSKTEDEAINFDKINYARQRIFDALREAEGDWVANWESGQNKYYASYSHQRKEVSINDNYISQKLEPQWYSSEEAWESVMVSHKDDLLLVWGIEG